MRAARRRGMGAVKRRPGRFSSLTKKSKPRPARIPAAVWAQYTSIVDAVFARPARAERTLKGVLAALNAQPLPESQTVINQHPEFAALLSHLSRAVGADHAEATAHALYDYVVRRHAVRACDMDYTRATRKMLDDL